MAQSAYDKITLFASIETLALALYENATADMQSPERYNDLTVGGRNHWRKQAHLLITELTVEASDGLFIKP